MRSPRLSPLLLLAVVSLPSPSQATDLIEALQLAGASQFAAAIQSDPAAAAIFFSNQVQTVFAPVDISTNSSTNSSTSRLRRRQSTAAALQQRLYQSTANTNTLGSMSSGSGLAMQSNDKNAAGKPQVFVSNPHSNATCGNVQKRLKRGNSDSDHHWPPWSWSQITMTATLYVTATSTELVTIISTVHDTESIIVPTTVRETDTKLVTVGLTIHDSEFITLPTTVTVQDTTFVTVAKPVTQTDLVDVPTTLVTTIRETETVVTTIRDTETVSFAVPTTVISTVDHVETFIQPTTVYQSFIRSTTIHDTETLIDSSTIHDTETLVVPTTIHDTESSTVFTTIHDTESFTESITIQSTESFTASTTVYDTESVTEATTVRQTESVTEATTAHETESVTESIVIDNTDFITVPTTLLTTILSTEPTTIVVTSTLQASELATQSTLVPVTVFTTVSTRVHTTVSTIVATRVSVTLLPAVTNSVLEISSGFGNLVSIIQGDIPYNGGIIHVVDDYFTLPQSLIDTANANGQTTFTSLASANGLTQTFNTTPDLTYFIPANSAFAQPNATRGYASIRDLLLGHAIPNFVGYLPALTNGSTYKSMGGSSFTVRRDSCDVFVNNARVVLPNVVVGNGVAHVVEQVIEPSSTPTAPKPNSASSLREGSLQHGLMIWSLVISLVLGLFM